MCIRFGIDGLHQPLKIMAYNKFIDNGVHYWNALAV